MKNARKPQAPRSTTGTPRESTVKQKAQAHERALRGRGAGGSTGQQSKHDR
jgi:hypothetical protein